MRERDSNLSLFWGKGKPVSHPRLGGGGKQGNMATIFNQMRGIETVLGYGTGDAGERYV